MFVSEPKLLEVLVAVGDLLESVLEEEGAVVVVSEVSTEDVVTETHLNALVFTPANQSSSIQSKTSLT